MLLPLPKRMPWPGGGGRDFKHMEKISAFKYGGEHYDFLRNIPAIFAKKRWLCKDFKCRIGSKRPYLFSGNTKERRDFLA